MPWHVKAKGGYARGSAEANDNVDMIYSILYNLGWTVNAISALCGNIQHEGGMNPWRWQSDKVPSVTQSPWTNRGYGLVQFTPGGKYINAAEAKAIAGYGPNFSDVTGSQNDGYAQVHFIDGYADYYPTSAYPLSYAEFKASTESPAYLASAWLYNYERPENPAGSEAQRQESAEYWYTYLSGEEPPTPPDPPGPGPGPGPSYRIRRIPIWMYGRRRLF